MLSTIIATKHSIDISQAIPDSVPNIYLKKSLIIPPIFLFLIIMIKRVVFFLPLALFDVFAVKANASWIAI